MATLGEQAIGATVKIKENGTAVNFLVVHQGNPDTSKYVGFENGTVLLRKDIHSKGVYYSSNNNYANSDLHAWGNGTYLNSIEEDVRNQIMQVKIPYRKGTSGSSVSSGANGLSCKVFFLSTKEVDSQKSYSPNEGAVFSYFSGGGDSKRIARYNGQADDWWLRSPYTDITYDSWLVNPDGYVSIDGTNGVYSSHGRRPAFVLPSSLIVDGDGNVQTNQPPSAPGSISVSTVTAGQSVTITLTAATDPDGTIASYRYERSVDGAGYTQIADVNSLTQTDTVGSDWATVQYRACAVDNNGVAGPYVTSDLEEVNQGYITVGGPADSNLGLKEKPFTIEFTLNVSGQTGVTNIEYTIRVDREITQTGLADQGESITETIDMRSMYAGRHSLSIVAEKSDELVPANITYYFTTPAYSMPSIQEGGSIGLMRDDTGAPLYPFTLANAVFGSNGITIENQIQNLKNEHKGTNGHLQHVDTATVWASQSRSYTRVAGEDYVVDAHSASAASGANTESVYINNAKQSGTYNIGTNGAIVVTVSADTITITCSAATAANAAMFTLYQYVHDVDEIAPDTDFTTFFTTLSEPHVVSAVSGGAHTVSDLDEALEAMVTANQNANYYIMSGVGDNAGNTYYVVTNNNIGTNATSAVASYAVTSGGTCTAWYENQSMSFINVSGLQATFQTYGGNNITEIETQGTAVTGQGSTLQDTLLAMVLTNPSWYRYTMTDGSTTYYVMSSSQISNSASEATNLTYCSAAGTYYTGGKFVLQIIYELPSFASGYGTANTLFGVEQALVESLVDLAGNEWLPDWAEHHAANANEALGAMMNAHSGWEFHQVNDSHGGVSIVGMPSNGQSALIPLGSYTHSWGNKNFSSSEATPVIYWGGCFMQKDDSTWYDGCMIGFDTKGLIYVDLTSQLYNTSLQNAPYTKFPGCFSGPNNFSNGNKGSTNSSLFDSDTYSTSNAAIYNGVNLSQGEGRLPIHFNVDSGDSALQYHAYAIIATSNNKYDLRNFIVNTFYSPPSGTDANDAYNTWGLVKYERATVFSETQTRNFVCNSPKGSWTTANDWNKRIDVIKRENW